MFMHILQIYICNSLASMYLGVLLQLESVDKIDNEIASFSVIPIKRLTCCSSHGVANDRWQRGINLWSDPRTMDCLGNIYWFWLLPLSPSSIRQLSVSTWSCPTFLCIAPLSCNPFLIVVGDERKKSSSQSLLLRPPSPSDDEDELVDSAILDSPSLDDAEDSNSRLLDDRNAVGMNLESRIAVALGDMTGEAGTSTLSGTTRSLVLIVFLPFKIWRDD